MSGTNTGRLRDTQAAPTPTAWAPPASTRRSEKRSAGHGMLEYPEGRYVSLCWDGPVERAGKQTFRARLTNFVPKSELTVYFFAPERSQRQ